MPPGDFAHNHDLKSLHQIFFLVKMPLQRPYFDPTAVDQNIQGDFLVGKLIGGWFGRRFILVVDLNDVRVGSFQLEAQLDSWSVTMRADDLVTSAMEGSFDASVSGRTEPMVRHPLDWKVRMSWRPMPRLAPAGG